MSFEDIIKELEKAFNETDWNIIEDLIESLKYWYKVTKKKILYEYIIFDGINDNEFKSVASGTAMVIYFHNYNPRNQ